MSLMERKSERIGLAISVVVTLLVCLELASIVRTTEWVMDVDEAVHAIEALRLYADLEAGRFGDFLVNSYFPERWHPPVNTNLRWYPIVHPLSLLPSFALLGPSDVSARIPSIFFFFGTCLVFFELARRLSRVGPALSGLSAVLLLLTSPLSLILATQSMTESVTLFFCYLAVLAYVWSVEREHPPLRAILAGIALGLAMLSKYDHGGVLALCLGVSELSRTGFRPFALLRSPARVLFLIAAGIVGLWFAHPDKLASLIDSWNHPVVLASWQIPVSAAFTLIGDYTAGIAVSALGIAAFFLLARRLDEPGVRGIWVWALISLPFYVFRARFQERQGIVEGVLLLLMLAIVLPELLNRVVSWLKRARERSDRRPARALILAGVVGSAAFLVLHLRPILFFDLGSGLLSRLTGDGHQSFIYSLFDRYELILYYIGFSGITACAGLLLLGLAARWAPLQALRGTAVAAVVIAWLPGAILIHIGLREMVTWDFEGHPQIGEVHAFITESAPPGTTVLLAGGWDQLGNNATRWYRATGQGWQPTDLAEVEVLGDLIGSLVLPPEPRMLYWAERLARGETLPERIVLIEPLDTFFYKTSMRPSARIYREILERRGSHAVIASRRFADLGSQVEILALQEVPEPVGLPEEIMAALEAQRAGQAVHLPQRMVGENGWQAGSMPERHFLRRHDAEHSLPPMLRLPWGPPASRP